VRVRNLPLRLTAGLFILNSGLNKLSAGDEAASGIHGMAAKAYPTFEGMEPQQFTKLLGAGEVALGTTLLLPIVPTPVAGLGLSGFAAGLLGLYFRLPGMRQEDGIRPSQQGTVLAKDIWLLGMGSGMVLDGLTRGNKNDKKRKRAKAKS
jgi:hypothetical protein